MDYDFWDSWKGKLIAAIIFIGGWLFLKWMASSTQGFVALLIGFVLFVYFACYHKSS
jgi:F0F1-type ATP synthase assembly protein I